MYESGGALNSTQSNPICFVRIIHMYEFVTVVDVFRGPKTNCGTIICE